MSALRPVNLIEDDNKEKDDTHRVIYHVQVQGFNSEIHESDLYLINHRWIWLDNELVKAVFLRPLAPQVREVPHQDVIPDDGANPAEIGISVPNCENEHRSMQNSQHHQNV